MGKRAESTIGSRPAPPPLHPWPRTLLPLSTLLAAPAGEAGRRRHGFVDTAGAGGGLRSRPEEGGGGAVIGGGTEGGSQGTGLHCRRRPLV